MQRLATYAEVGLLVPAIAVFATAAREGELQAPAIDIAATEHVDISETTPLAKYPGACTEALDFRFPTHIGADGIPDEVITRTYDAHARLATLLSQRADAPDRIWTYRYDASGRLIEEARSA